MSVQGGTLDARRLDRFDPNAHGSYYRNEWAPKQDGEAGHWWFVSPVCDTARLSGEFAVTEHEDGTISVYPSLVFDRPGQSGFHGHLDRGVWSWGTFEDRRYGGLVVSGNKERRGFRRLRVAWRFRVWPWQLPRGWRYLDGPGVTAADIVRGEELARKHGWQ